MGAVSHKAIEKLEDASLLTNVMGMANHQLLIHNTCWMAALQSMALKAVFVGRRR